MTKIRIKKSLIEAKFITNSDNVDKILPKLGKEDMVKVVDETEVIEPSDDEETNPIITKEKLEEFVRKQNRL